MTIVATVCVRGRRVMRLGRTPRRLKLLGAVSNRLADVGMPVDAVLLPAGFFRVSARVAPSAAAAENEVLRSEIAEPCQAFAGRLAHFRPGAVLVAGIDTEPYGGFSGDQLMVAWGADGIVGAARKWFPTFGDVEGRKRPPYLMFEADADCTGRLVALPDGKLAILGVCYDAFGWVDGRFGASNKRRAIEYLHDPDVGWRFSTAEERDGLVRRQGILAEQADLALVGVHGFKRRGRDVYWQRHGIAAASAVLGGRPVLGAAHYQKGWPFDWPGGGDLAAVGVPSRHLGQGQRRRAHRWEASRWVLVRDPDRNRVAALLRIYEL